MKPFIKDLKKKFDLLNNQIEESKSGKFFDPVRYSTIVKSKHKALEELQELINKEKQRNY